MTRILPEILRTIFTLVREERGLRALTDISAVCKTWRDVALPVLWSHVVLNNDTLQNFVENHANSTHQLSFVRSMTLHIQVITSLHPSEYDNDTFESYKLHGSPKSRTLNQNIEQFSNLILAKLMSLESFSLFVDAPALDEARQRINRFDIGFWLDMSVLGHLLRSLPASCTSLELETSGTDWSPRPESHHLCLDIRSIMPRLRHIKLRIYSLCSKILLWNPEAPGDRRNEPDLRLLRPDIGDLVRADHLSTLSICMVWRATAGHGFVTCPDLQIDLDRGMNPLHIHGRGGHQTKPPLLASNLVSGYKMGCFPAATKLEVLQMYEFVEDYPSDEDDLDFWPVLSDQEMQRQELYGCAMLLRDCVEDKTFPLPYRYIAEAMHGMYDKSDTCWVGAQDDLTRHAENTVWDETVYGARMPFGANGALSGATPRPPPLLLTRKEWRQRSKKGMLSWRREEGRPGVKIKRVIPLDGVDVEFEHTLMPLLPARGEPIPGDDRGVL
jgi:hypothetical protein